MKPLRDEDLERTGAFVDGEMSGEERARFELRLSVEPELAQAVERLLATDELVRRHARGSTDRSRADAATKENPRRRFRLVPALIAVAAAILAIFGARALFQSDRPRTATVEVAIAESFESAAEWIASVPELADQRPPGLDELRSANEPPNADPRTFVDAARRAEARAFAAPTAAETNAMFFTLSLRAARPTQVLVFGFPEQGLPFRYWPSPEDTTERSAILDPGDHVLPAPSFALVEDPRGARVEYRRGFLVPIGAVRLDVVVATRDDDTPLDLADLAPGVGAAETAARLRSVGFAVRTLAVRER